MTTKLHDDCWVEISLHLKLKDIGSLRKTSRRFCNLFGDKYLLFRWKEVFNSIRFYTDPAENFASYKRLITDVRFLKEIWEKFGNKNQSVLVRPEDNDVKVSDVDTFIKKYPVDVEMITKYWCVTCSASKRWLGILSNPYLIEFSHVIQYWPYGDRFFIVFEREWPETATCDITLREFKYDSNTGTISNIYQNHLLSSYLSSSYMEETCDSILIGSLILLKVTRKSGKNEFVIFDWFFWKRRLLFEE